MAKKLKSVGRCRVCGNIGPLTVEHILPRAAGGGDKTKIYTGDEVIKAVSRKKELLNSEGDEKPRGRIQQNGFTGFTLCKSCNNHSGLHYDKDFADLYNAVRYFVYREAKDMNVTTIEELDEFLSSKGLSIKLTKLKLNNIAKRILVAFCSVEHPGLTDRKPEIRKAIIQKEYKPNVDKFSIYLKPHVGANGYFGTIAILGTNGTAHAYAGIELGHIAFYLADHDAHLRGGPLERCVDITSWLTDYGYNQEAGELELFANFEKSLALNIPSWAFE